MKKIILTILICGFMVLGLTGCETKTDVSIEKLNDINNKIIDYFQQKGTEMYNNYSYNYVDEKNKVVIVGLVDNSLEEQKWFKENIVNSKYIKFEQGEVFTSETFNVSSKIDSIVNNGPQTSSNPFDYIKTS